MILALTAGLLMQSAAACDSIVAAARADTVPSAIYVTVRRIDGEMSRAQETSLALNVGTAFIPPRPLKLSVFGAAPVLRVLRTSGGDTLTQLRAPNITGIYEVAIGKSDSVRIRVARASLIAGFDSAAIEAIRGASMVREVFKPPFGDDSMRVDVRFSTDSIAGSERLVSALFPRMPVVDAAPRPDNPPLSYPAEALADSLPGETVVLRFIVGREGVPEPGTLEAVRVASVVFLRAAVAALPSQRFRPATIRGCPVAQVVDFPMAFVPPANPPD